MLSFTTSNFLRFHYVELSTLSLRFHNVELSLRFHYVELSQRRTFTTDVANPVRGCMFIDTLRPESTSGRICEAAFAVGFEQLGRT